MNKKQKTELTEQREHNFKEGIDVNDLLEEMFNNTDVRFIGSKVFMPDGGWEKAESDYLNSMFTVTKPNPKNKKQLLEFHVEADAEILEDLELLNNESIFGLPMKMAVQYLRENGYTFQILYEDLATIIE